MPIGQLPPDCHLGADGKPQAPFQAATQTAQARKLQPAAGDGLFFERPLEYPAVTSVGFGEQGGLTVQVLRRDLVLPGQGMIGPCRQDQVLGPKHAHIDFF